MTGLMKSNTQGMSFEEWKRIAKGLRSAYTNDRFLPDTDALKVWYELLKDLPYEQVSVAAYKYMEMEHYPPTPSDLRKALVPEREEWDEAWGRVIHAVRYYGSWDTKKAIESLDPLTRKVVKNFGGFERICDLEYKDMDILRSNFRDTYNTYVAREKESAQLSPQIKGLINEMLSNSGTKALNENRPCERLELSNE